MHVCAHVYTCVRVYMQRTLRILGTFGIEWWKDYRNRFSLRERETRGVKLNLTYFSFLPRAHG